MENNQYPTILVLGASETGCFGEPDSLSSILPGIERAYLNVRYKSSFHISGEEVDLLITKTENAQNEYADWSLYMATFCFLTYPLRRFRTSANQEQVKGLYKSKYSVRRYMCWPGHVPI